MREITKVGKIFWFVFSTRIILMVIPSGVHAAEERVFLEGVYITATAAPDTQWSIGDKYSADFYRKLELDYNETCVGL